MYSKNNVMMNAEKKATKAPKYGLAKLSVGVASVLLGTTLVYGGANAKADVATPVNDGALTTQTSSASTSSAAASSEAAKVTSADVQSASATASAAASNADANKANVQSASDALNAATKANQAVANVNKALASANAATSTENEALTASYKANDAESAAQSAYDEAQGKVYPGWEKDYNNFRAISDTNVKNLASAQAKQAKYEKYVNELKADSAAAQANVTAAQKALDAASYKVSVYEGANTPKTDAGYKQALNDVQKAQQQLSDANAQVAENAGVLSDWSQKLADAKKATEVAQATVDYDNGKSALSDKDQAIMDAKKASEELPALKVKLDAAKANHEALYAAAQKAVDAAKAAKNAYEQAKLDNNLPSADQLAVLEDNASATSATVAVAKQALDDVATSAGVTSAQAEVTKLERDIANNENNIAKAQAEVDKMQAEVKSAADKYNKAKALSDADKEDPSLATKADAAHATYNLLSNALTEAQYSLDKFSQVKVNQENDLATKQAALKKAEDNSAYVKALSAYNDAKAKADAAANKVKLAKETLAATKGATEAINKAQTCCCTTKGP